MMNTQLDETLERYEAAIKNLNCSKIEIEHVLNILNARDAVQAAFKQAKHSSNSSILKRLILADAQLRDKAGAITQTIKTEEWEDWRSNVHPPVEAWWWRLDAILTALETTALNLTGTKLVVLSACDTSLGQDKTGEGVYSFRRALVIAGSESQVMSLWKVDDTATKDLMIGYYEKVLGKQGKQQGRSEALRQTQLEMLRGNRGDKYQHPYYWAAFIPSGDWRVMGE